MNIIHEHLQSMTNTQPNIPLSNQLDSWCHPKRYTNPPSIDSEHFTHCMSNHVLNKKYHVCESEPSEPTAVGPNVYLQLIGTDSIRTTFTERYPPRKE